MWLTRLSLRRPVTLAMALDPESSAAGDPFDKMGRGKT